MRSREEWINLARQYYQERAINGLDRNQANYRNRFSDFMGRLAENSRTPDELREQFDGLAKDYLEFGYDPLFGPNFICASSFMACKIEELKPKRVLDTGCGIGFDLLFRARHFPEIEFVGCDMSPKMIETARAHATLMGIRNTKFLEIAHEDLSPENLGGVVDLCTLDSALFYKGFDGLVKNLRGVSRILRDEGIFILCGPVDEKMGTNEHVCRIVGFSSLRDQLVVNTHDTRFSLSVFQKIEDPTEEIVQIRLALALQPQW
ncbi:MAG: methyltransferase domain-containing protein [Patescibacteria group bacterium]